jgi:hypothetical protein
VRAGRFLKQVAPKAFLIMDEAHNAGGQAPRRRRDDRFTDKKQGTRRARRCSAS